jgi:cell division protein FtsL
MLSKKPMSFSEMIEVLGVSNSFLNYHLENLGELISKTDDSKYKLSSFGEAAIATMTKVEDIPITVPHQSPETRANKIVGRSVVTALGIICIILVASLGGAIATYTFVINDKNDAISSLRSQISQLNSNATNLQKQITSYNSTINSLMSQVTNLQKQINDLLNATSVSVDEITANPSAWVNKRVVVEGNTILDWDWGWGWWWPPWNFGLSSNETTIGVSWQGSLDNGKNVLVLGVVTEGQWNELLANGTTATYGSIVYFIKAETIEPL